MWWRQTKALVVRQTFPLLSRMHARDHFPRLVVSCELSTNIYAFDFLEEGKNTLKCNLEIHALSYSSYHDFSGHSNIIVDLLLHLSGKPLFEMCCFHGHYSLGRRVVRTGSYWYVHFLHFRKVKKTDAKNRV